MRTSQIDPQMENCISDCLNCYRVCQRVLAVNVCDLERREPVGEVQAQMLADCATICATSADFMIRNSPRHVLTCGVCATICEACAAECDMSHEMVV